MITLNDLDIVEEETSTWAPILLTEAQYDEAGVMSGNWEVCSHCISRAILRLTLDFLLCKGLREELARIPDAECDQFLARGGSIAVAQDKAAIWGKDKLKQWLASSRNEGQQRERLRPLVK